MLKIAPGCNNPRQNHLNKVRVSQVCTGPCNTCKVGLACGDRWISVQPVLSAVSCGVLMRMDREVDIKD